ncbi:MAG: tetratricopeptide repeat protein [Acidobacteria bacterium]|nr:tetratricopeptide repeat protein [Acidobacteriota bacterium]
MPSSDRRSLLSLVAAVTLLAATLSPAAETASSHAAFSAAASVIEAAAALEAGRALLRRNRADEALPQLESARSLYARAGDTLGSAAARDAIGDIYQRQGQHAVALAHYQPAYEAFRAKNDCANAALLAVKIGETHYLAGDAEAARAAFARMGECDAGRGGAGVAATAGGASGGVRGPRPRPTRGQRGEQRRQRGERRRQLGRRGGRARE